MEVLKKLFCCAVALCSFAVLVLADDKDTETPKVTMGASDYFSYCAVCHGLKGEGDGPMYDILKVPPADLSRIAKRNNGEFPTQRIEQVIERGGNLRGHGISSMLAWGKVFEEYDEDIAPEKRIRALAEFLETLQVH
ncbi:MAG: c-type cytochrome [Hyphomicrobiaceae bacterium]